MNNPIACILSFLSNSPEYRRYLNLFHKNIDSDELEIDYSSFKLAFDYMEEKI